MAEHNSMEELIDSVITEPTEETDAKPNTDESGEPTKTETEETGSEGAGGEQEVPEKEAEGKVDESDDILAEEKTKSELDDIKLEESASKKAHENFDRLKERSKTEIAERDSRIAELQDQLAKAQESQLKPEEQERYQALEKKVEEYEEQLRLVDLQHHPEFRGKYDNKIAKIEKSIGELAQDYDVDAQKIINAVNLKGRARTEELENLLGDFSEVDKQDIVGSLRDLRALKAERQEELGRASERLKEYNAAQQERQRKESQKHSEMQKSRFEEIFGGFDTPFKKDKEVSASARQEAERILLSPESTYDEAAEAVIKGQLYEPALKMARDFRERALKAEARLKEINGSDTEINTTGGSPKSGPKNLDDMVNEVLNG